MPLRPSPPAASNDASAANVTQASPRNAKVRGAAHSGSNVTVDRVAVARARYLKAQRARAKEERADGVGDGTGELVELKSFLDDGEDDADGAGGEFDEFAGGEGGLDATTAAANEGGPNSNQPLGVHVSDKHALCIDVLISGHVNSFVDFFYLTHRSEEDAGTRVDVPDTQLPFVQQQLCAAEQAHRRGDSQLMYASYERLADFFQETTDYKTSIYFYEKCLDIAETTGDLASQGNSQLNLGLTHDQMGDVPTAILFHERHLRIATEMDDADRFQAANHQLVEAYRRYAEIHETREHHTQAVDYYKKCLIAASDAKDLRAEGVATYRLGVACANLGDLPQSIEFQQRYLDICKRMGDQHGEGAACAALAHSFKELGDTKLAIKYLEKYLDISARTNQALSQAEACSALGSIYSSQGHHHTAVEYFEKTFEIARSVGDRKLVDQARVNLGMARGNMAIGGYMHVVTSDLSSLLKWKTRRVVFRQSAGSAAASSSSSDK